MTIVPLRIVALLCLGVASLIAFPLSDYDFFWHLATGDLILQEGQLPAADPFAFTGDGRRWLLEGWLTQVLFALADRIGDWALRFTATLPVLGVALAMYASSRAMGIGTGGAAKLSLIGLAALLPFLSMRPILFTYACFSLTLLALLRYRRGGRVLWLWGLLPLFLLWANLHPAFTIGYALVLGFALTDLLQRWAPIRGSGRPLRPLIVRETAPPVSMLLLAGLVTPYGIEYPWLIIQKIAADSATVRIEEWMPLNLGASHAKTLLFLIVVFFTAWIFAARRPRWDEWLLPVVLMVAAFRSTRFMAFAAIVLVVFSAAPLAQLSRPLVDAVPWLRLSPETTRPLAPDLRRRLNWAILVAGLVVAVLVGSMHRRFDTAGLHRRLPVGAMRFVEAHGIGGCVFNDYNAGGYIIRMGYPRQRVFIDTRYTLHPPSVRDDYLPLVGAAPGWEAILARYPIDYVLVESRAPLRQVLVQRGDFRLVYSDGVFSVLVRADAYPQLPTIPADLPRDVERARRPI